MKYENSYTYHSKAMANAKVFADKQTDKRTDAETKRPKTICTDLSMLVHKSVCNLAIRTMKLQNFPKEKPDFGLSMSLSSYFTYFPANLIIKSLQFSCSRTTTPTFQKLRYLGKNL